jgi:excisionase family DNA binding protein
MKTLSTTEVAQRLGVTRERVRQLCDEGRLKAEKMGRDWRILPAALEEYQRLQGKAHSLKTVEIIGGITDGR